MSLVAADGGFADGERPCLLRLLGPYSSLSPSASLSHAAELMEACACTVSSIFCGWEHHLDTHTLHTPTVEEATPRVNSEDPLTVSGTTQAVAFHLITQIHTLGVLW